MGTREELPEAPKEQIVFMEDMSESELASALQLPAGLTNLGNTCYMNATVQCLRTVPELQDILKKFAFFQKLIYYLFSTKSFNY